MDPGNGHLHQKKVGDPVKDACGFSYSRNDAIACKMCNVMGQCHFIDPTFCYTDELGVRHAKMWCEACNKQFIIDKAPGTY